MRADLETGVGIESGVESGDISRSLSAKNLYALLKSLDFFRCTGELVKVF